MRKKMATQLVLKACLLLALTALVEIIIFLSPVSREALNYTYFSEWRVKHDSLIAPGRDRVILVGGSSTAFGVDSSTLEASIHRPTINMGLNAGLGLQLMLNEVQESARTGDFVILMPEYEHFYGGILNGDIELAELVQYDRRALRYLTSWGQWKNLTRHATVMNSRAVFAVLDYAKTGVRRRDAPRSETATVYRPEGFDAHGDMVAHLDFAPVPSRLSAVERIPGEFNGAAIRAIARCAEIMARRGVTFIVVYPPVTARYWTVNLDLIEQVAARMPPHLALTTPADSVLGEEFFYDTFYHLNRRGRALHTARLATIARRMTSADAGNRRRRPACFQCPSEHS
jgi:hypothetical protein